MSTVLEALALGKAIASTQMKIRVISHLQRGLDAAGPMFQTCAVERVRLVRKLAKLRNKERALRK